ncbi:MAG TPA: DUF998 domain-containing protein [Ktedonobacterales bacterium]|nr:DUF998 domain-containing protein [Ktedonobacterales bacterium]
MSVQQIAEEGAVVVNTPPQARGAAQARETNGQAAPRAPVIQRFLLACSIVGALLFNGTYLITGAIRPGYDSLRIPISSLEAGPQGWIQITNFIVFGVFSLGFAVGLRMALARGIGAILAPLLEVLVGVGLIGDGLFTQDPLHTACDILTFTAAVGVCIVLAVRFVHDSRWRGWTAYSLATVVLTIACLVVFGAAMSHHGYAGLFERLAVIIRSAWVILLTVRVLMGVGLAPQSEGATRV